jgi:hypothetical protein
MLKNWKWKRRKNKMIDFKDKKDLDIKHIANKNRIAIWKYENYKIIIQIKK